MSSDIIIIKIFVLFTNLSIFYMFIYIYIYI